MAHHLSYFFLVIVFFTDCVYEMLFAVDYKYRMLCFGNISELNDSNIPFNSNFSTIIVLSIIFLSLSVFEAQYG